MRAATVERIEAAGPLRRAVTVWYAVLGSIGAWTVHLVSEASLVRWAANVRAEWILHVDSAACVAATLLAMGLAWRLRAAGAGADEGGVEDGGQLLFLGNLGLLLGAIDLALIVIEAAYAVALYQPHLVR